MKNYKKLLELYMLTILNIMIREKKQKILQLYTIKLDLVLVPNFLKKTRIGYDNTF